MWLMSLRHKILFVTKEVIYPCRFDKTSERKFRNELRQILKFLAISDKHENSDKFNKCKTDISNVKTSENIKESEKPENKLLTRLPSLKVSLHEIKKIKAIHILNIGMFIIHLDYPIVTITTTPSCTVHANNELKNVNIVIFAVQVNIFRSVV